MDLTDLSAAELSAAIRARRVSCREAMNAYLDRIDALNPAINAIVSLRDRQALVAEADARDAELARGLWRGWMHGFPHAVKDLAATAGIRTTLGSPSLAEFVPRHDAFFVERLRAAGAVLVGKTNVPEFGLGSQTYNAVFGATRNPHDSSLTAGGSSGGAAAALAARLVPVADGSDMMGSLRNPAAFCNVFGFRPSFGRVPAGPGTEPFLQQLSTDGPMARSVEDLALLMGTMAGHDSRAPLSLPGDGREFAALAGEATAGAATPAATPGRPLAGVRIGWLADWGGHLPMQPGVLEVCRGALGVMADLGARIEEAPPPFDGERLWRTWITLRSTLVGGRLHEHWRDERLRARMKPEAQWEAQRGTTADALGFYRASESRAAWHAAALAAFERFDLIALPAAQVFPFAVEQHWPDEVAGRAMDTYHRWMEVTIAASLLGAPAISVPAGFGAAAQEVAAQGVAAQGVAAQGRADAAAGRAAGSVAAGARGRPMGLQLIGAPRQDLAVLRAALAYDRATHWPQRVVLHAG